MQSDSRGDGALPPRSRVRDMLRVRRPRFLPVTVRLNAVAALTLLLCSGCAGPPGGSMIAGPLPEPEPPPPEPEQIEGKEALGARIEAAGGFEGMVALFDSEVTDHAQGMLRNLIEEGVPEDRIWFPETTLSTDLRQFEHEQNADLRARTKVAHMPQHAPFSEDEDPGIVAAHNIVWAVAAGNTHALHPGGDRDFWRPDHHYWLRDPSWHEDEFGNHLKAFATGKVLLVTYAKRDEEGSYEPIETLVRCGEARDACLAIWRQAETGGTSDASAKLAAAAFYVFQLYEKAEEVVDTLKECAVDIGEQGVDVEFGHGLLNLACERIENAEVLTASSSLVLRWDAPALEGLLDGRPSSGVRVRASRWIADRDGLPLARLWARYGLGHLDLAMSAGRGRVPLGVGSRYANARAAPYAAAGAGWRLFGSAGRNLSAVISAGRGGGALSPRTTRAGLAWRVSSEHRSWSAYAGRSQVKAWVGIPGHRAADRGRSPAGSSGWEGLLTFQRRH